MNIDRVVSDIFLSNMYIVSESGHGIIVDPCRNLDIFDPNLVYDWIILTHEHIDHISGVDIWKDKSNAKVCEVENALRIYEILNIICLNFDIFNELQTFTRSVMA